jgi:hypothetical protein
MRLSLLSLLLALLCGTTARTAFAQTDLSIGLGANTVRYSGGSTTSGSISPGFRFTSPTSFLDVSGIIAAMSEGQWSSVGRGSVWLSTRASLGGLRLGAEGSLAGTTHTGGPWTASAYGLGEVFRAGARGGVGVAAGPSSGWIRDQPSVTAFHTRARAWWLPGGVNWTASVEPTHFLGAWFTDATAGVSLERGPVVASVWGAARLSQTYPNRTVAGGAITWYVRPILSLELSGGSYLPDPYQGLTGAKYLAAGVRLHSDRRAPRPATVPRDNPLVPQRQGDSLLLHFQMPGARSVALAGDWDGWTEHRLAPGEPGHWTGSLALKPGVYHFVLLVDGKDWVVPGGVARVSDGMGGFAALLVVPEE